MLCRSGIQAYKGEKMPGLAIVKVVGTIGDHTKAESCSLLISSSVHGSTCNTRQLYLV